MRGTRNERGPLQLRASDIASHAHEAVSLRLGKPQSSGGSKQPGSTVRSSGLLTVIGRPTIHSECNEATRGDQRRWNRATCQFFAWGVPQSRHHGRHLLRRELRDSHNGIAPKGPSLASAFARIKRPVAEIGIGHLGDFIESESPRLSDHERDAALGAVAALAMMNKWSGWRDLHREEKNVFNPVSPVEYWMPLDIPT